MTENNNNLNEEQLKKATGGTAEEYEKLTKILTSCGDIAWHASVKAFSVPSKLWEYINTAEKTLDLDTRITNVESALNELKKGSRDMNLVPYSKDYNYIKENLEYVLKASKTAIYIK